MWDVPCPDISGLRIAAFFAGPSGSGRVGVASRSPSAGTVGRPAAQNVAVVDGVRVARWVRSRQTRTSRCWRTLARYQIWWSSPPGKGSLSRLFPRNDVRSTFDSAQRSLAMLYVRGPAVVAVDDREVNFSAISGVGEYITYPALAESGPCTIMLFESILAGDMDLWAGAASGTELLSRGRAVLNRYLPEHAEATSDADLIDSGATLVGAVTPMVRRPDQSLPCRRATRF